MRPRKRVPSSKRRNPGLVSESVNAFATASQQEVSPAEQPEQYPSERELRQSLEASCPESTVQARAERLELLRLESA